MHPIITVPNMTVETIDIWLSCILLGYLVYFISGLSATIFKKSSVEGEKL